MGTITGTISKETENSGGNSGKASFRETPVAGGATFERIGDTIVKTVVTTEEFVIDMTEPETPKKEAESPKPEPQTRWETETKQK